MSAPLLARFQGVLPPLATDVEDTYIICRAPFAGTLTAASHIPDAAITGAATNNRKVAVVNKGQAGAGVVEMAAKTYDTGINGVAFDEGALTLSGTPANLVVAEGDVIAWASTAPGTGLADPGGGYYIEISRS